jgi:molecular chaperone Hsp33
VSKALASLSKKDLNDLINDGEEIEVKCDFCNTTYQFTIQELKRLGNK